MQEILILTTAAFIAGCTYMPSKLVKSGPIFAFGLAVLVALGSLISVVGGIGVGYSIIIGLSVSLVLFALRIYFDSVFRFDVKKVFLIQYIPVLISGAFFVFVLQSFEIDYASRNFDAGYAIQDAIFLTSNPANLSFQVGDQLLPLDWSASLKDRYGVSFLLALVNTLGIVSIWWSAKYVMLFLMLILFVTLLVLVKEIFEANRVELVAVGSFLLVTPSFVLPVQYFMFGQVFGLILSLCAMYFLCQPNQSRTNLTLVAFIAVILFIAYPAMAFPLALLLLNFIFVFNGRTLSFRSRLFLFLQVAFISSLFLLFFYGFRLKIIIERIWSWISGVLFPQQAAPETNPLQVGIFGQYASEIGVPLFTGILKYPNFTTINDVQIALFGILSICVFIVFVSAQNLVARPESKLMLNSFIFSWGLMAAVAYLKGSAYLFYKFGTWIMPLVTSFMVVYLLRFFSRKRNLSVVSFQKFLVFTTISSLVLISVAGVQHISQIERWNSFSQISKSVHFAEMNSLKLGGSSKIYLSTPSAEEGVWLSGLLGSIDQSRFVGLGATKQALGGALARDCSPTSAQRNFDKNALILQDEEVLDVVGLLDFDSTTKVRSGSISVNSAKNLRSGIVLNSGGLYPYESISAPPNSTVKGLRWSTGQVCFSVFTERSQAIDLRMLYERGPDLEEMLPWDVNFGSGEIESRTTEKALQFKFMAAPGWNTVQVLQPGCYLPKSSPRERWNLRADDRGLCFKLLSISASDVSDN